MKIHRLLDDEYYRLSICGLKNKSLILEEELLKTQIEIANKRISDIRSERSQADNDKEAIVGDICGRLGVDKGNTKYEIRLQNSIESSSISIDI